MSRRRIFDEAENYVQDLEAKLDDLEWKLDSRDNKIDSLEEDLEDEKIKNMSLTKVIVALVEDLSDDEKVEALRKLVISAKLEAADLQTVISRLKSFYNQPQ